MASAVAQRLAACSWPPGESVVLESSGRGRVSLNFGVRVSRAGLSHLGDFALRCAATIVPVIGEVPSGVHLVGLDGRELRVLSMLSSAARPFQDPVDLSFELCKAYFETGRRLYYKGEFASAGRAFDGLVEVFQRMGGDAGPAAGRAGECLGWFRIACANAERRGVSAKMDELVRVAESCASDNPGIDESYDLLEIMLSRARLLVASKRVQDAEKILVRSINVSQAALVRAGWHWYLRRSIGRAYRILAGVYEDSSRYDLEIGARQCYMNVWGEAFQSLDAGRSHQLSQDHEILRLEALRSEMAKPRGEREFSVQCRVGDDLERVTVYATAVRWPKDPLEDQSEYLRRYRNVIIPEVIREKFRRVHKFAHDKDVSFVEACAVEFGTEVLSR